MKTTLGIDGRTRCPNRHPTAKRRAEQAEHRDGDHQPPPGNAGRANGGNLAVGREASEPDQHAHQHAHRNGVGERLGNGEQEQASDFRALRGRADEQLHHRPDRADEEDEREEDPAD